MHLVLKSVSNKISTIVMVAVIGSVWGLLEMTLGGFLHTIHFVGKGAVMGSIAISLMTIFFTTTKKPLLIPVLGIIAASFKPFSAMIYGQPVFSAYVINPATAIVLEAVAFAMVVFALNRYMENRLLPRVFAGFLAGSLGIIFYAVVASIFGMGKWPMLDVADKIDAIFESALPIAITGALVLIASYPIGKIGMPKLFKVKESHPRLYYSASMALVAICWAIPVTFHL